MNKILKKIGKFLKFLYTILDKNLITPIFQEDAATRIYSRKQHQWQKHYGKRDDFVYTAKFYQRNFA